MKEYGMKEARDLVEDLGMPNAKKYEIALQGMLEKRYKGCWYDHYNGSIVYEIIGLTLEFEGSIDFMYEMVKYVYNVMNLKCEENAKYNLLEL